MVTPMPSATADRLSVLALTYDGAGATAAEDPALPGGFDHLRVREVVGADDEAFDRAAARILSWRMHERAGLRVEATSGTVEPGVQAVLTLRVGPARLTAPVRVVHVVRDGHRAGFSYGTLPGHPERGEEGFHVERAADGTVTATVVAFSRPDRWFARLGGPVTRLAQRRAARSYIDALR